MTTTKKRIGRVSERPLAYLHWYVGVTRTLGLMAGILLAYLEYLHRTETPDEEVDGFKYYRFGIQDVRHDLVRLARTPIDRPTMQNRMHTLVAKGIARRAKLGARGDNVWYYALDEVGLAKYLASQDENVPAGFIDSFGGDGEDS